MSRAPGAPVVGVEELAAAWAAICAGQFRPGPARPGAPGDHAVWVPQGEEVLVVLGCAGSVGASTLALAVAGAHGRARVVECANPTASGLAGACTAELGQLQAGWVSGRREQVLVQRLAQPVSCPAQLPLPGPPPPSPERGPVLTVIDVGWEVGQVAAAPCWLSHLLTDAAPVVAVTCATVAGLRRLEGVAEVLAPQEVLPVVLGAPQRRWARGVGASAGPRTRALIEQGALLQVPHEAALAVRGLDSTALPAGVIRAARQVLRAHQMRSMKGSS